MSGHYSKSPAKHVKSFSFFKSIMAFSLCILPLLTNSQNAFEGEIMRMEREICTYHPEAPTDIIAAQLRSIAAKTTSRTPCSTFNVSYNGFPPEAEAAFEFAISIWASIIDSPIPITVEANFTPLASGVLGSAGSNGFFRNFDNAVPDTFYPRALAEKIRGSEIVLGSEGNQNPSVDIFCNFNSNRSDWYYGTDGNVSGGEIDFVTVVLHELGHGLGFVGFGFVDGGTGIGEIRLSTPPNPSIFDTFILDGLGDSVLNYADPSVTLGGILTSPLQCDGPEAILANNNARPSMYSPATFQQGSSYSHWDLANFPVDSPLMRPSLAPGLSIHDPGPVTNAFFEDMGWSLCATLSNSEFEEDLFSISPVPFTDRLQIGINGGGPQELELTIFDITGKVVFKSIESPINNRIEINNLDSLERAVYFINIRDTQSNNELTGKLIKS